MNKNINSAVAIILLVIIAVVVYLVIQFTSTSVDNTELLNNRDVSAIEPDLNRETDENTLPPDSVFEDSSEEGPLTGIRLELRDIMLEIEANTVLGATSVDQCLLLPLGHSPCGGPAFYHVYAASGSNQNRLLELSAEHQALAEQINQANEAMGICMITPEPDIKIVAGNCTAVLQ